MNSNEGSEVKMNKKETLGSALGEAPEGGPCGLGPERQGRSCLAEF